MRAVGPRAPGERGCTWQSDQDDSKRMVEQAGAAGRSRGARGRHPRSSADPSAAGRAPGLDDPCAEGECAGCAADVLSRLGRRARRRCVLEVSPSRHADIGGDRSPMAPAFGTETRDGYREPRHPTRAQGGVLAAVRHPRRRHRRPGVRRFSAGEVVARRPRTMQTPGTIGLVKKTNGCVPTPAQGCADLAHAQTGLRAWRAPRALQGAIDLDHARIGRCLRTSILAWHFSRDFPVG